MEVTSTASATVTFFWRGRSHSYWRTHTAEWPVFSIGKVAVKPSTLVTALFAVPKSLQTCDRKGKNCYLDLNGDGKADTLLDALSYGGGSGLSGAARVLLRAAVAGLLNEQTFGAAYPPYMSVGDLTADVNKALGSLNRTTMMNLANTLDHWNDGVP